MTEAAGALGGLLFPVAWVAVIVIRFAVLANQLRGLARARGRLGAALADEAGQPGLARARGRPLSSGFSAAWTRLGRLFLLRLLAGALAILLGRWLHVFPQLAGGLLINELVRLAITLRDSRHRPRQLSSAPLAPVDRRRVSLLAASGALELANLALFLLALAGLAGSWPIACGALFLGAESALHLALARRALQASRTQIAPTS
jgi:hypothetical protein